MSENGQGPNNPEGEGNIFDHERSLYAVSLAANNDWEECWLHDMHLWVKTSRQTNLARFEPKITFGDYTALSDSLMSNWAQRDWSGGMLYGDLNESSDTERYRISNAETRFPHLLTQNLEVLEYELGPSVDFAGPLADFTMGGTRWLIAHADTALKRWEPSSDTWSDQATLSAVPVAKGVVYRGLLYIPFGANGYQTWDGLSAPVAGTAGVTPLNFCLWDDKLVALEHDGQMNIFDGTAWLSDTAWLDRVKLHSEQRPRHVVTWWNPQQEPALFLITDEQVYTYEPVAQMLYPTGLHYPRHPDQGLAVSPWRDNNLYVNVGIGVHQMSTGQVISAVGLDRGDGNGLPVELRGKIVDFEPEYNGLIAVVEGLQGGVQPEPGRTAARVLEETSLFDDPVVFGPLPLTPGGPRGGAKSALFRYNGIGWHPIWESPSVLGVPTRALISSANDDYNLVWGYGGRLFRQRQRRSFHNPRVGLQAKIDRFQKTAYLKSGRFDANMSGFLKTADLLELVTAPEHSGRIDVYFNSDRYTRKYLGYADQADTRTYLPFNLDGDEFPEGMPFRWIEFEYELSAAGGTQACALDTAILRFIKVPITTFSWTFDVRFSGEDPGEFGWGPTEAVDHLNDLASSYRFIMFKHRQRVYRTRVAQVNADTRAGLDRRAQASLSLIQVSWDKAPF